MSWPINLFPSPKDLPQADLSIMPLSSLAEVKIFKEGLQEEPLPLKTRTPTLFSQIGNYVATKTSWAGWKVFQRAYHATTWAAGKTAEFTLFTSGCTSEEKEKVVGQLEELTGSKEFGLLIQTVPILSETVKKKVFGSGILSGVVEKEKDFLNDLLGVMLGKIALNVGKDLKKARSENSATSSLVFPIDLCQHLFSIVHSKVKMLQQTLTESETEDEETRKALSQKASLEAATSLLEILVPGGGVDLPVRSGLKGFLWSYLKTKVVPELMLEMASFSYDLKKFSKMEKLNQDTAILKNAVESCSYLVSCQFDALSNPAIATAISKAILNNLTPEQNEKGNALVPWLSKMLQSLPTNENPFVDKFKSLGCTFVEALLSHMFYHLSLDVPKGKDPLLSIIERFLNTIQGFKVDADSFVNEISLSLIQEGIDPKENERYIDCFKPLSLSFMKILGLQNLNLTLPCVLTPLIESIEEKLQEEYFPKLFARCYDELICPLVQAYQNVLKPDIASHSQDLKVLPGGEFLAKQGVEIKSALMEELPNFLIENKKEIGELVCQKTMEFAKKIDQKSKYVFTGERDYLLNHDDVLKRKFLWIEPWVIQGLEAFKSHDPRTLCALKFVESRIDAVFAHSVRAIYKKNRMMHGPLPEDRGLSGEVIDEILTVIGKYIDMYGSDLSKRHDELCNLHASPESDAEFKALLLPLAMSLYDLFGFNDLRGLPVPEIIKPFLKEIVMDALPMFFAKHYNEILGVKESIADSILQLGEIFRSANSDQVESQVSKIEQLCDILSDKASDSLINNLLALTSEGVQNKSTPVVKQFSNKYLKSIVKSILLQALVNYLQGLRRDGFPQDGDILSFTLSKLKNILSFRFVEDADSIHAAERVIGAQERKTALSIALIPLSKDLLKLIAPQDLSDNKDFHLIVPFQSAFEGVFNLIAGKLLPDLLADFYLEKRSWKGLTDAVNGEGLSLSNSQYIPESCRVIAAWVANLLPVSLYRDKEIIAEAVYMAAKKHLRELNDPRGLSLEEYLKENERALKETFCLDFLRTFTPESDLSKGMQSLTQEYIELLLAKLFNGLIKRIHEAQGNSEDRDELLVNLSIQLLSVADKHFKAINKISGKRQPFEVSHEEFLHGFEHLEKSESGEKLALGVPKSLQAIAADKKIRSTLKILDKERARYERLRNPNDKSKCMERIRAAQKDLRAAKSVLEEERQVFLRPLSEFLLELAGIAKPENFPFPKAMQTESFDLFKNILLPAVLNQIYESILDPATINASMMAGLTLLNESLDSPNDTVQTDVPKDEKQQRLNKVCGELILELLQQIPESYTRIILKIDKLKKFTTESVGESVRRQLGENLNLAKIFENGLISGISNLREGKWDTKNGKMQFIPGKWVKIEERSKFIPDEKVVGEPKDAISFSFAMTDDELEAEERKRLKNNKMAEIEMKELMVKTAHRLTSDAFFYSLKAPFLYFLNLWNKAVDYVFGRYAPQVREFFKYNGERLIFKLMESFFSFVYKTATLVPWIFIDMYNARKAEVFTKNMHLRIHENLRFGLSNALMETLSNNKLNNKENSFDSLIKLAEARDLEAEKERQAYLKHWNLPLD